MGAARSAGVAGFHDVVWVFERARKDVELEQARSIQRVLLLKKHRQLFRNPVMQADENRRKAKPLTCGEGEKPGATLG